MEPLDVGLDDRVREHRERLGRELTADVYGSEEQRELILAPRVWHVEPPEMLALRRPAGATSTPQMYQAAGVRVPLGAELEVLGREALLALLAMRVEAFDPWSLPSQCLSQYLVDCVPDWERRRTYEHFTLSTRESHWLTVSCSYDDLDDAAMLVTADLALALPERLIGNWLLRMLGAVTLLRRNEVDWWRPQSGESGY